MSLLKPGQIENFLVSWSLDSSSASSWRDHAEIDVWNDVGCVLVEPGDDKFSQLRGSDRIDTVAFSRAPQEEQGLSISGVEWIAFSSFCVHPMSERNGLAPSLSLSA